jgi:MFS family permease
MARDLRLFYLFRLLATSYLWVPIFIPFKQSRGLSFLEIMILGGIYSAVVIVCEIPTGAFADRIGRRTSMMAGALTMALSCLIAYGSHGMAGFAVSEALAAVSMSLCSGADSAYLFDLLDGHGVAHEYGRRESTASAWHQAGSALAYAAGGALAEIDLGLPYLATALVALARSRPRPRWPTIAGPARRPRAALRAPAPGAPGDRGARTCARRWPTSPATAAGVDDRLLGGAFVLLRATEHLYQPLLKSHHLSYVEIGLVFAAVYLVAAFVAHRGWALRQRIGDEPLLWCMLGGLALSFVLLAEVRGPWVLMLLGVQAIANGLYSPLVKPLINREIPDSGRRATVLSVESIVRRAAMGVFAPLAGLYGAHSAMQLCGVVGLGGMAVLAAVTLRRVTWRGAPTP